MANSQKFEPIYLEKDHPGESPASRHLIDTQRFESNIEGGYHQLVNINPLSIANPFKLTSSGLSETKNVSSSIYYLLTSHSPKGHWHRNRSQIYHAQHIGSARYVIIHAEEWEPGKHARIETAVLGPNVERGEVLQLVVKGGTYKASYLVDPGTNIVDGRETEGPGCLLSEVVVPAFDYADHDFLTRERLYELVGDEMGAQLEWLIKKQ